MVSGFGVSGPFLLRVSSVFCGGVRQGRGPVGGSGLRDLDSGAKGIGWTELSL